MPRRLAPHLVAALAVGLAVPVALLGALLGASASSCKKADSVAHGDAGAPESDAGTETDDLPLGTSESDAGGGRIAMAPGMREVELVGAMNFQTSILSEMDWPPEVEDPKRARRARRRSPPGSARADAGHTSTSQRIGYLRHGATAPVITIALPNDACPEGWLELVAGGFVCGKAVTFDLKNPRVSRAPRPPDMKGALPYVYGAVVAAGTPVYRRVLSKADRAIYESAPVAAREQDAGVFDDDNPYAREAREAHEARERASVTLEDLHGRGVLVRKLARGFILALDREFRAADAQWWRTTGGFAVPHERIFPMQPVAEPRGRWLSAHTEPSGAAAPALVETAADAAVTAVPGAALPDASGVAPAPRFGNGSVVFVKSKFAQRYKVNVDTKQVVWGAPIPANSVVELTGPRFDQGGATFRETTGDFWMRTSDGIVVTPAPPEDLGPGEKWIDVDMTLQTLVAFEGMRPVYATRVSTGRRNAVDHEKDHPTPAGAFRIREKHITATMDGDVASDGPYSIEDVPWVMYFEGSYALHGAFWHNAFGTPRSHGCVNIAPADAKELFSWVEPRLPEGWHGVYATESTPGTRVVIHGEAR